MNQLIEEALERFFYQLKKAEYMKSFRRAAEDEEQLSLVEDGLADYLKIIDVP